MDAPLNLGVKINPLSLGAWAYRVSAKHDRKDMFKELVCKCADHWPSSTAWKTIFRDLLSVSKVQGRTSSMCEPSCLPWRSLVKFGKIWRSHTVIFM